MIARPKKKKGIEAKKPTKNIPKPSETKRHHSTEGTKTKRNKKAPLNRRSDQSQYTTKTDNQAENQTRLEFQVVQTDTNFEPTQNQQRKEKNKKQKKTSHVVLIQVPGT